MMYVANPSSSRTKMNRIGSFFFCKYILFVICTPYMDVSSDSGKRLDIFSFPNSDKTLVVSSSKVHIYVLYGVVIYLSLVLFAAQS